MGVGDGKISGADLARGFYRDVVAPLVGVELPNLRHAAGRLGSGSDVLGLDDAMSRDHDWGCRLTLLVDQADQGALPKLAAALERGRPDRHRGLPTRFATTWSPDQAHQVELATVGEFAASRLGVNPLRPLTVVDWLSLTGQSVLEVTAGPVFTDTTVELRAVVERLRWYPDDVERHVLAAGWQRLAQRLPFIGRTAETGQHVQSRLLAAASATDVMRQAFLLRRRWAPYPKWIEARFRTLPGAGEIAAPLQAAVAASDWRTREDSLVAAIEGLLTWQRERGLPTPDSGVTPFWDRPYRNVDPAVPEALLSSVTDPEVRALPPGVGSVEQWIDNVGVLTWPERRRAAAARSSGLTSPAAR